MLSEDITGDLIEAGVWRGGAGILMRAVLDLHGSDRTVWLADSFQGFPDTHGQIPVLPTPLAEVRANFDKYGLDGGVEFVEGWFEETLPRCGTGRGRWSGSTPTSTSRPSQPSSTCTPGSAQVVS